MSTRQTLVRSLITLTDRQKDSLDLFARNIIRNRKPTNQSEKITTSTLLRCLTDIFMDKWGYLNLEDIHTEAELFKRITELFR